MSLLEKGSCTAAWRRIPSFVKSFASRCNAATTHHAEWRDRRNDHLRNSKVFPRSAVMSLKRGLHNCIHLSITSVTRRIVAGPFHSLHSASTTLAFRLSSNFNRRNIDVWQPSHRRGCPRGFARTIQTILPYLGHRCIILMTRPKIALFVAFFHCNKTCAALKM